jgi:hypothetical protein
MAVNYIHSKIVTITSATTNSWHSSHHRAHRSNKEKPKSITHGHREAHKSNQKTPNPNQRCQPSHIANPQSPHIVNCKPTTTKHRKPKQRNPWEQTQIPQPIRASQNPSLQKRTDRSKPKFETQPNA